MIELYSIKDVARIFGLREARLRYWVSSGFLWPSVRRGGQFFYTFQDLITIKTATELFERGVSMQKVRAALTALRAELPDGVQPSSRLRVCSDGNSVVVVDDDVVYEPVTGQVVMAFAVSSLHSQIADLLRLPTPRARTAEETGGGEGVPAAFDETAAVTLEQPLPSGYQLFQNGCAAEDEGDLAAAERCYRQCLELEPHLAAAHTNLGNLLYRQGQRGEARGAYERALELDPDQPEARFNLGNLLDEVGETELAIAELRHVVSRAPDFADAHYNLGLILARVGGLAQAREHFGRYLHLDAESEWASHAKHFLSGVA